MSINKTQTKLLRKAINAGDYFLAKLLLDRGVDPDACSLRGNTAMHRAVIGGDQSMIDLVLAYDPDLGALNSSGQTPGALAERLGDRDTAVKLGHAVMQPQRSFGF